MPFVGLRCKMIALSTGLESQYDSHESVILLGCFATIMTVACMRSTKDVVPHDVRNKHTAY